MTRHALTARASMLAGLAILVALPRPSAGADAPPSIAVDIAIRDGEHVETLSILAPSGAEAKSAPAATMAHERVSTGPAATLSATVRPTLQANGRIKVHYAIESLEVTRWNAAGSETLRPDVPHVRDVRIVDDAVIEDGGTVTRAMGGLSVSLRARRVAQQAAPDGAHPVEARIRQN